MPVQQSQCTAAIAPRIHYRYRSLAPLRCHPQPQELRVSAFRILPLLVCFASFTIPTWAATPATGGCGSQAKVPSAQRVSNTAHWTTASEEENFGYDVYRGTSKNGPFVKLTKQPILGHGTTNDTHNYEYVDATIDPCKDYWYYVESIATDGAREKFTPIFRAPAKRHAQSATVKPPAR